MEEERKIWLGGKIVPLSQATINVLSPTSQFGANVFEGIRCYWNKEEKQLYAFKLQEHYKRLLNSIKMFQMDNQYSLEDLQQALVDVVRANNFREDIAVRQTVFVDGFGNWAATGPINMFVAPIAKKRNDINSIKALKCCVSSWERISDRNLSPKVKVGANYINSRLAQLEAIRNGYDSAIFMNHNGKIAEGPGSCLFIVRGGVLITPPCTASVLESITRDTIMEIASSELGIKVVERDIDRTELYICDEAFLCGSAVEISSIGSIDGYKVNDMNSTITKKLHKTYLDVVSGKLKNYKKWLVEIY